VVSWLNLMKRESTRVTQARTLVPGAKMGRFGGEKEGLKGGNEGLKGRKRKVLRGE
jgi:hypothetical protein